MRYNRSLFTVYSFITRHLFQFCTKNFHLRPKQVFPPFLLSLFSYFCFKIKYHLILTKNENNLSFHATILHNASLAPTVIHKVAPFLLTK